jgi:uncharacterized protein (DUF1015 family)
MAPSAPGRDGSAQRTSAPSAPCDNRARPDPKVNRNVAEFLPFRGIRYDYDAADRDVGTVVAPPYDVIDDDQRAVLLERDPYNSVRLILPEGGDEERYDAAAADFRSWQREQRLRRDAAPSFYLYRMRFRDDAGRPRQTLGVIGALRLPEPGDDSVLPHERTLPKAKSDRLSLLRATRANFDPIWGLSLTSGLSELLEPPEPDGTECVDDEGVQHTLWPVDDADRVDAIRDAVARNRLVLADGHHRFETALAYRDELRSRGVPVDGADSIMTFVVELAEEQLVVRPIHRLVSGLSHPWDLRSALLRSFNILDAGPNTAEALEALQRRMRSEGGLGVVDGAGLALAVPSPEALEAGLAGFDQPVRHIDAAVFEALVVPALEPLGSPQVVYRHDASECAALVDKGAADAAVLLRPAGVDQIRAVAFAGSRMPQKTTFFHPKPRTGLVFRALDEVACP